MQAKSIHNELLDYEELYIYGAHSRAKGMVAYLKDYRIEERLKAFIVTDCCGNPKEIDGIPVISLDKTSDLEKKGLVIIATKKAFHDQIQLDLSEYKFKHILKLTPAVDNQLRLEFIRNHFKQMNKPFMTVHEAAYETMMNTLYVADNDTDKVRIYMARNIHDKTMSEISYPYWIIPIQAGSALTDKKICQIQDDIGQNISFKNKEYCELTAIYWMWKNVIHEYIGICQYRRHFIICEDELKRLSLAKADVVLPIPAVVYPSVSEDYAQRHIAADWQIMLDLLKEKYSDYYDSAKKVSEQMYYYPCNMWIMKYTVFLPFCQWLFPILQDLEGLCERKTDDYQSRYIGFLAERLTTIYMEHHSNQLQILYAEKLFTG